MSVAILVVSDGRDDYLGRAIASLDAQVSGDVTERWLYDDTGDTRHTLRLAGWFPHFRVFAAGARLGFGGAIAYTWSYLAEQSNAGMVAHVEQDFVFNRDVDLDAMAEVLLAQPHLAQMALRRQPWNEQERAAGGIVEEHPDAYTDHTDGRGRAWLEHRLFFTTNVCLYRAGLMAGGWPAGEHSEGRFGFQLREHGLPWGVPGEQVRFGFWGRRGDSPWVEHIGEVRAGTGY